MHHQHLTSIKILEQSQIHPDATCIEYAARYHHRGIFDWLIEQFPASLNDFSLSKLCFKCGFAHGIIAHEKFELAEALEGSGELGLISLTKSLISHPSIGNIDLNRSLKKILFQAFECYDVEMVKMLLCESVIKINTGDVILLLLSSIN